MSRDSLHDLVDRIPEEELPAAKRFLEYLGSVRLIGQLYAQHRTTSLLRKLTPLQSLGRVKKSAQAK
jgi:hypothetical protein